MATVKGRLKKAIAAGKEHKPEERARIILEAVTMGDADTCSKYAITPRTLRRWRRSLKTGSCPEVTERVREKRHALDNEWAAKVPGCLNSCVEFLSESARTAERTDPDVIHAIAGALKIVAEVAMAWKTIDARISGQAGADGAANRPLPSGNVTPIRKTG